MKDEPDKRVSKVTPVLSDPDLPNPAEMFKNLMKSDKVKRISKSNKDVDAGERFWFEDVKLHEEAVADSDGIQDVVQTNHEEEEEYVETKIQERDFETLDGLDEKPVIDTFHSSQSKPLDIDMKDEPDKHVPIITPVLSDPDLPNPA